MVFFLSSGNKLEENGKTRKIWYSTVLKLSIFLEVAGQSIEFVMHFKLMGVLIDDRLRLD